MPILTESPIQTKSGQTMASQTKAKIMAEFIATRAYSLEICAPLEIEDLVVQTDFVVSPLKWHLGHTAWLFEHFILMPHLPDYKVFHPGFHLIFNSYYTSQGTLMDKNNRGMLSRPTVKEVLAYRTYVEEHILRLAEALEYKFESILDLIELGIQHEKQHQELMLYDIKHIFWSNPLKPVYHNTPLPKSTNSSELAWTEFQGGVDRFGYQGDGFCYDNEQPAHCVFLEDFALANRCVTNGEYLAFIEAGGYDDARFWLANGWARKNQEGWVAPHYWHKEDGRWFEFTMHGTMDLDLGLPVCHVSHYEADAFARWAGFRLPTEFELEKLYKLYAAGDNTAAKRMYHPQEQAKEEQAEPAAVIGDVWEWSQSAYLPYPGYDFMNNGLGEYNGKFMNNQIVLRGGSCMTPANHLRYSYRNFFESGSRWQCSGIRLAKSI